MAKNFDEMEDSNRSRNPDIHRVSDPARRVVLQGGLGALAAGLWAPWLAGCASAGSMGGPLLGFNSVPVTEKDTLVVPAGYSAVAIAAWGEPVGMPGNMPAWKPDASNSAADQAVQMGMHHDGIHYFPIDGSSTRGLLVMNHEYTDDGLLHTDGMKPWTAEKTCKSQAAHGVAVIEVELKGGRWQMVRPSKYARRFTAYSPFAVSGPAAGHRADEDCRRPERAPGAGHAEQLRQRHDALGHLPVGRGELGLLLQRRREDGGRPDPLGPAQGRLLPLGDDR